MSKRRRQDVDDRKTKKARTLDSDTDDDQELVVAFGLDGKSFHIPKSCVAQSDVLGVVCENTQSNRILYPNISEQHGSLVLDWMRLHGSLGVSSVCQPLKNGLMERSGVSVEDRKFINRVSDLGVDTLCHIMETANRLGVRGLHVLCAAKFAELIKQADGIGNVRKILCREK